MICQNCGTTLPEDSVFCPNCGTKLENQPAFEQAKQHTTKCHKCGSELQKGTVFCPVCGTNISESANSSATNKLSFKDFLKRYKLPVIIAIVLCCFLIVVFFLFQDGPKNENELAMDLPENITVISVDNEPVFLDVAQLEIEKRKTKDGTDLVYCKIDLESDYIVMTAYQTMYYTEYDGNEWFLENVTSYKDPVIGLQPESDSAYAKAIEEIEDYDDSYEGFESYIKDYTVSHSKLDITYKFNIEKQTDVLNISGIISVTLSVSGNSDYGFYTSAKIDDSKVKTEWTLTGKWVSSYSEDYYGTIYYEDMSIEINSLSADAIDCTWEYTSRYVESETESGDETTCAFDNCHDYLRLLIQTDIHYDPLEIKIYPNGDIKFISPISDPIYMEKQE